MSYTGSIKNELSMVLPEKRCCRLSEISALLNTAGGAGENAILFKTDNWAVARKYFTLLKKTFNINVESRYVKKAKHDKNSFYELVVTDEAEVGRLLNAAGADADSLAAGHIPGLLVKSDCCKQAYLRGAFLAGGTIASPEKEYHLEITLKSKNNAMELISLLSYFDIGAKTKPRAESVSVYIKGGERIADFLNATGAKNALFSYENARVMKDVRNDVNRRVNCDTANIGKTVRAAAKQIAAIEIIDRTIGISSLPATLRHAALARTENPDLRLEELGTLLGIGKSGINHRLRKIEEIARELEQG